MFEGKSHWNHKGKENYMEMSGARVDNGKGKGGTRGVSGGVVLMGVDSMWETW